MIAPTLVVCVAGPASADVTSVAGGAFGVSAAVTVPVTGALGLAPSPLVVLPTTGGGPITRTAAKATVGSLASTGVLTVSTSGDTQVSHGRTTRSSATVDALNVAGRLSASTVTNRCASNGDGSSGSTTLEGVNGIVTATVPAPNTVVPSSWPATGGAAPMPPARARPAAERCRQPPAAPGSPQCAATAQIRSLRLRRR